MGSRRADDDDAMISEPRRLISADTLLKAFTLAISRGLF
jgi:hypothetical protein